jgi:hypothetical protein
MKKDNYNIGDVIVLKAHHQLNIDEKVVIIGDPDAVVPYMTITETVFEKAGENVDTEKIISVKAIWYNHLRGSFESAWFKVFEIRPVIFPENTNSLTNLMSGDLLEIKSSNLEYRKIKSSMNTPELRLRSKTYSSLLTFVPPPLIMIDTVSNKKKDNGQNQFSEKLIRCRYFNGKTLKYTEISLPSEVLRLIPWPDQTLILKIVDAIKNNFFIKDLIEFSYDYRLVKPLRILSQSGHYVLEVYDILTNEERTIPIDSISQNFKSTRGILNSLPQFSDEPSFSITEINHETIQNIFTSSNKKKPFVTIDYKNKLDQLLKRTVRFESIHKRDLSDEYYMEAYCYTRGAIRFFKISKIQRLIQWDIDLV